MGVIFSRGRKVIRSKKAATWGCSSIWLRRMLKNSALPGTNWGRTYRFSWLGFFPSRFSQLYSIRPTQAMSSSSFCKGSRSSLVSFISCPMVLGLRTPIFRATSAISSVTRSARPQYSGSLPLTPLSLAGTRSVIMATSFAILGRGSSTTGMVKGSFSCSRGNAVGRSPLMFFPMSNLLHFRPTGGFFDTNSLL